MPNIIFGRQQHFSQALYHYLHTLDVTRPVVTNDGWAATETDIVGFIIMPMVHLRNRYCYTQITDVEQEINGLLAYGRKPKCNMKEIRKINDGIM